MTTYKEFLKLADEAWAGQLDMQQTHHPVQTFYGGSAEVLEGVLGFQGIGGFFVFDTGDGLVFVDAGMHQECERVVMEVRKWRPDAPIKAVIFSHHHIDHVGAPARLDQEAMERGFDKPEVIAHELLPKHFDRYLKTLGWNTAINCRQFGFYNEGFHWPAEYRYPDTTFNDQHTFTLGDLTFELNHARGETDDHVWTWVEEKRAVMPGDLFIWATPNAGNPQKVQRYVSDWADALDAMAAKNPRVILPGHGFPIYGEDRAQEALTTTATLLRDVETQTLALMNKGWSLDEVIHGVQLPHELLKKPYLQPVYDHPQFLIRMIWRRYGGWWDGQFDTLLPATKVSEAKEWVRLAGGTGPILARATELMASDLALSCHLVEMAVHAEPDNSDVHTLRAKIYKAYSEAQQSSMARNILNHAAQASLRQKRDLARSE